MAMRAARRVIRTWHMDSRRWDGYAPRAGDVVILTHPKCGTTWMQQIVSLLIFQSPEPRPVIEISPWIDARFRTPTQEVMARIEAQTHRRFLKTHLPLDAIPVCDDVRYIHVARDGLDAFMSWHNHTLRSNASEVLDRAGLADETIGRPYPRPAASPRAYFQSWIGAPDAPAASEFDAAYFLSLEAGCWAQRHRPNLLMVHYDDLAADLSGEMSRIADFLAIETPAARWPSLVEAASFEAMRRNGAAIMPNARTGWKGGHEGFLYKGVNGRWRGVLSEEQIAVYRRRVREELPGGLAHWLQDGAAAALT